MLRSYLLPFALIVMVLAIWEYSKPSYPVVNADTRVAEQHGPPPPHNANERTFQEHRVSLRKQTMKALQQPWARYCDGEGRKRLASSMREYFYHRSGQELSYPARWGGTGRAYIQGQWSTTEDRYIEQRIQDLYSLGYLDPKALDSATATRIATIVKGLPVNQQPCKG